MLEPIKPTKSHIKVNENMIGTRLRSFSRTRKQIDNIKEKDERDISFESILKEANAEDFFIQMNQFSQLIK